MTLTPRSATKTGTPAHPLALTEAKQLVPPPPLVPSNDQRRKLAADHTSRVWVRGVLCVLWFTACSMPESGNNAHTQGRRANREWRRDLKQSRMDGPRLKSSTAATPTHRRIFPLGCCGSLITWPDCGRLILGGRAKTSSKLCSRRSVQFVPKHTIRRQHVRA